MSSNISMIVKTKDFPESINAINKLFSIKKLIELNSEYKFYYFDEKNIKIDLNDLILKHMRRNLRLNGSSSIEIFAEKVEIKVNYIGFLSESIIIKGEDKPSFEEIFEIVGKETLECLLRNEYVEVYDIIEKHDFYGYKKYFQYFEKIISHLNNKVDSLKKEKEIAGIIVSNFEDSILKTMKENERLKIELEKYVLINNLGADKNNTPITESIFKIDNIIKSLNEIHKNVVDNKDFYDNKIISDLLKVSIINPLPFQDSNYKLNLIDEFLNKFKIITIQLLESLNLNQVYLYYKETLKKTIFCNLCNNFKKPCYEENKICERHILCETCNKNYSKKINFIKSKKCYCQALV